MLLSGISKLIIIVQTNTCGNGKNGKKKKKCAPTKVIWFAMGITKELLVTSTLERGKKRKEKWSLD